MSQIPIPSLAGVSSISPGDLLVLYITRESDPRQTPVSGLQTYMQNNLTFASSGQPEYTTQNALPSASGFVVVISQNVDNPINVHLILSPTGTFALGTITLPLSSGVIDKQEVLVNCTQQVVSLVIDGNGAFAITGAPISLAANDFFRLKFDLPTQTWYRVG
jgi:hypothetical protein